MISWFSLHDTFHAEVWGVRKAQHYGQDVALVLPQIGGALHFEKPPLQRRSTPVFLSHPSEYRFKGREHGRSRGENSNKNLLCRENDAVVSCSEGGGVVIYCCGVFIWGSSLPPTSWGPKLSWNSKNTFFQIDCKAIGGQGSKKYFQMSGVCCLAGEPTYELSIWANTASNLLTKWSIICSKVCTALNHPKGVTKYLKRPNSMIIAVFWMSSVATGIWR